MAGPQDHSAAGAAYWDEPVYQYLVRCRRSANESEARRLDDLIAQAVAGRLSGDVYRALQEEARQQRKERKQNRRRKAGRRSPPHTRTPINTADLKKRIYNPRVSRENMIKALEALPAAERKATIDGLSPGLKRKLGSYLKSS